PLEARDVLLRAAREVDGVLGRRGRREHAADRAREPGREHGKLEPEARSDVRRDDPVAAAVAEYRDAASAGPPSEEQRLRRVDELPRGRDAENARRPARG